MSRTRALVWCGLALLAGTAAHALTEPAAYQGLEIPRAEAVVNADVGRLAVSHAAMDRLSQDSRHDWTVWSWNTATSSAHLAYGRYETGAGSIESRETAESVARAFVADQADLFGVPNRDLDAVVTHQEGSKWGVSFVQRHEGLRVIEGRADVVMTEAGRIFVIGNDLYRDVDISVAPSLSDVDARVRAVNHVGQGQLTGVRGTELVILPVHGPTGVTHRLAWLVQHDVISPPAEWASFVDAQTGDILWRYNRTRFIDYVGSVEGDVEDPDYCNGVVPNSDMANMELTVTGLPTVLTGADGSFTVPFVGDELRQATATFDGPWFSINNLAGAEGSVIMNIQSGVNATLYYDNSNSIVDERNCWVHANRVHDFMNVVDPAFTAINYLAPVTVRNTGGICPGNAWYSSSNGSINFCTAGSGFANTSQIGDVIYHEYGHSITDRVYSGGFGDPPGDLHEGNSDVIANILNNNSIIGNGFFQDNCGSGIRDADNTLQYPGDLTGAGHTDGQIIAGFVWDMFQELIVSEGSLSGAQAVAADIWHFSRALGHPYSQPDQVFWSFVADDDNGLLEDGTPHHAAICVGASNHGFDCPEVQLVILRHDGTESTDTPGDVTIAAESVGVSSPVDEVRLFYKKNNEIVFTEVALGNVGGDDYEGVIAGLTVPTEVFYYLESEDQLGNIQRLPASAPDVFAFDVATIFDQAETDLGWTVNPDATDDATTGQWNRMDPQGTAAQPEDDYSVTGTDCWVTNGVAGAQLGTNDVDGGTTTLQSPAYNVTGSVAIAKVKYYRWYSNDQGAAPGSDTWVVQARNNGGAWTTVESTILSSNAWVQHTVNLLTQFGTVGVVEFRFLASDLGSGSIVEAAVDDVTVLADLGGIVDVEIEPTDGGVPAVTYLAGARPNPFNPRTSIQYGLDASSDVRLEVFDVTGRLVTTLVNTNQTAGNYSVVWDGRDASGVSASSGVYYTRLTTNRAVKQQKLTLVR